MSAHPRVVIAGTSPEGHSVVAFDGPAVPVCPAAMPGYEIAVIWGADVPPEVPCSGDSPPYHGVYPPKGGSRLVLIRFPPNQDVDLNLQPDFDIIAALQELDEKLPGLSAAVAEMAADGSGMHTTRTVDYAVVIEGTMVLQLDDDQQVELSAGSVLVMAGARHGWRNEGSRSALVAFAMVGVEGGL